MTNFADLQRDSGDLGELVNENKLVATRYGGNKKSWQYLTDQFEAEFAEHLLEINKSRGFRVVGTFAVGFDYELFNDVGIDASGNSWIYVGAGAPTKTVTAGTTPSAPDYQQVTFNSIDAVAGLREELNDRALQLTLTEAQARTNLMVGQYVRLTDRGGLWEVTTDTPNTFNILDIGGGKALSLVDYKNWLPFGVTKSDSSDQAPAINAYLANLETRGKMGDSGSYTIRSPLTIGNTIELSTPTGTELFIQDDFPAGQPVLTIDPSGAGNERLIKVEGLSLIPTTEGNAGDAISIDLTDPSAILANFEMSRVLTEQFGGYALRLINPNQVDGFFSSTIQRCKFKGGVYLERVGDSVNLLELTISGNKEGIRATSIEGASQVVIEKTNITASGGAIYLQGFVEQCKMRDLQIEQSSPYTGDLPSGKRACIALIGNGTYVNDQSSIESSNINSFSYADGCIHLEGVNGTSIRDNTLAIRTASRPIATGSFEVGGTITDRDEVLVLSATGDYYRWDGDLPKVVPSSSTPATTGGVSDGAWILNADQNGNADNTNYNQKHITIRSSCRNVKIYTDNSFISSDTTTNTTPVIEDLGVGTCGIVKTLPSSALSNGWVYTDQANFPLEFYKCPVTNQVSLSGSIKDGTTTAGTQIAQMPAGFTPKNSVREGVTTSSNIRFTCAYKGTASGVYGTAYLQIDSTGAITILSDIPANSTLYLDLSYVGDSVFD